jgi:hypothetical protein
MTTVRCTSRGLPVGRRRTYCRRIEVRCFINDHPAGVAYPMLPVRSGRGRPYVVWHGHRMDWDEAVGYVELRVVRKGLTFPNDVVA